MKKKIIFVTFCLILFLIFTTMSYGLDPRQIRLREDPWGHMKSPPILEDPNMDLVLIVIDLDFALLLSLPHLDSHSDQQKAGIQNNQFNQPKFGD